MSAYKVVAILIATISVGALYADSKKENSDTKSPTRPKFISATHLLKRDLSSRCTKTGRIAYIESGGKRIAVLNKDGQLLLLADPAKELKLEEYRVRDTNRVLRRVRFTDQGLLGWSYNNSQFGCIHVESGTIEFWGQD